MHTTLSYKFSLRSISVLSFSPSVDLPSSLSSWNGSTENFVYISRSTMCATVSTHLTHFDLNWSANGYHLPECCHWAFLPSSDGHLASLCHGTLSWEGWRLPPNTVTSCHLQHHRPVHDDDITEAVSYGTGAECSLPWHFMRWKSLNAARWDRDLMYLQVTNTQCTYYWCCVLYRTLP